MRRLIPSRQGDGGKEAQRQSPQTTPRSPAALAPSCALRHDGIPRARRSVLGIYWSLSTRALARTVAKIEAAAIAETVRAGLAVNEVLVEGRVESTRAQLLKTVGIRRGDPIPDARYARGSRAPDRPRLGGQRRSRAAAAGYGLFCAFWERKALAIWQRKGSFVLIDRTGAVIGTQGLERYGHLKIIVGKDAPRHAPALLDMLATAPPLMKRVRAAVWVSGRRWNLRLDDGIDIRLPEENAQAAWTRLATLERDRQLLSQDIIAIDLRIRDRLVVRRRGEVVKTPENST